MELCIQNVNSIHLQRGTRYTQRIYRNGSALNDTLYLLLHFQEIMSEIILSKKNRKERRNDAHFKM